MSSYKAVLVSFFLASASFVLVNPLAALAADECNCVSGGVTIHTNQDPLKSGYYHNVALTPGDESFLKRQCETVLHGIFQSNSPDYTCTNITSDPILNVGLSECISPDKWFLLQSFLNITKSAAQSYALSVNYTASCVFQHNAPAVAGGATSSPVATGSAAVASTKACVCSGTVGLSGPGKIAFTTAGEAYGVTETDIATACRAQNGTYADFTCSGASAIVPTVQEASCNAGVDAVEASLVSQFGVPPALATAAKVMVNYAVNCSWEEPPTNIPNPAAGLTAGGGTGVSLVANVAGGTGATGVQKKKDKDCPDGIDKNATCLPNPLGTITTAEGIVGKVINGMLGIIGALTLLMMVWGGFQWLTSAGNSERIEAGSKTMLWAAVGVFLVFSSYLILSTFTNLLTGAS